MPVNKRKMSSSNQEAGDVAGASSSSATTLASVPNHPVHGKVRWVGAIPAEPTPVIRQIFTFMNAPAACPAGLKAIVAANEAGSLALYLDKKAKIPDTGVVFEAVGEVRWVDGIGVVALFADAITPLKDQAASPSPAKKQAKGKDKDSKDKDSKDSKAVVGAHFGAHLCTSAAATKVAVAPLAGSCPSEYKVHPCSYLSNRYIYPHISLSLSLSSMFVAHPLPFIYFSFHFRHVTG